MEKKQSKTTKKAAPKAAKKAVPVKVLTKSLKQNVKKSVKPTEAHVYAGPLLPDRFTPEGIVSLYYGQPLDSHSAGLDVPEPVKEPVLVTLPFKAAVAALWITADIASGRSIMPILSNVRIAVAAGKATIQATDLEKSWTGTVPAEGGPIVACIPVGVLLQEIKALPKGTETVELLFTGSTATHTASVSVNGRCEIHTQDVEEYTEIGKLPEAGDLPVCGNLLNGLKRVLPAASTDETRYVLTGVMLDFTHSKVVATDGFRLHTDDIQPDTSLAAAIIPLASVKLMVRHEVSGAIGWTDNKHLACQMGEGIFTTRVIEGNYPDYENMVPKHNKNVVNFNRDEFLGLFTGASIIDTVFRLTVNGDLNIESEGCEGRYNWHIPCEKKGNDIVLNFNGRFLVDAIRSYPLERVTMKIPDAYGACLLNEKAVVMPIRV
jgi:DNA polymerase-3 subunit beta